MKYGMRRVLKNEFEAEPENYELRIGFPDSPLCTYGNHFTKVGYDFVNGEYVWFTKSILKDVKLKKKEYIS